MAVPVTIKVNGLAGCACTIEATAEWTVSQVQEAIFEKTGVSIGRQSLLSGAERLLPEASVQSLLADDEGPCLRLSLVILQAPKGFVNFVGCCNGLEQVRPGNLLKSDGVGYKWDATAVSSEGFEIGAGSGIRFRPARVEMSFMIGLGRKPSAPTDFREIDFALCFGGSVGRLMIAEMGAIRFRSENWYEANSVAEIRVSDKVDYIVDERLEFSSALNGQQTLYAMASFLTIGAEALEIMWL